MKLMKHLYGQAASPNEADEIPENPYYSQCGSSANEVWRKFTSQGTREMIMTVNDGFFPVHWYKRFQNECWNM
jgi:hypothetical protein